MRILFIDDELEIEILVKILQTRHPEDKIDLCDSLASARDTIWRSRYDVVVFDIMMGVDDKAVPGSSDQSGLISGLGLHAAMRADQNCPNHDTPAVILTGLLTKEHPKVKEAEASFGSQFLQKPMSVDSLYDILKTAKYPAR